ncbi:MAG: radical SAM protein [Candidatus Aenigmatarchaeota archaeon]
MCVVTFDWEENDAKEKVEQFRKMGSVAWAVIEVTNNCNLNCKWCYANSGYKTRVKREHMDFESLEKLVRTLQDAGVRQITYSGGEPTVYPKIREAVALAKGHDFIVHMNTNGFSLTKTLARELKKAGLTQIQTNIDSVDPRKHDAIRGRKGSFSRAVKALKNAREMGMTCVSQTVLTRENEEEIECIFSFARGLGIQRCRIWDMMPSHGTAIENIDLKPDDYIESLRKLVDYAERTGCRHIEAGEPFFPAGCGKAMKVSHVPCVASHGVLANFAYNGDVYYCVTQRKPMFNVFRDLEGGFESFYKKELDKLLKSERLNPECAVCGMLETCKGGCLTRRSYAADGKDYWCHVRPSSRQPGAFCRAG